MSTTMVQIRNVPAVLHRQLKARAALEGMSMSDYLKRDIVRQASRPAWEQFDEMLSNDPPVELTAEQIVAYVHEGRR